MNAREQMFIAEEKDIHDRLDKVLVARFPDRTRQYFQKILKQGCVAVNSKEAKASTLLRIGEKVVINFPPVRKLKLEGKDIPLDIIYEDKDVLVINKPAGMVVHPGVGESHMHDSLVNAILHHCKGQLSGINGVMRPGIVHRLDKDTSGLLVVAKTDVAHQSLADQFMKRKVEKTYYALLVGKLEPMKGVIEAPIGRDPRDRKKMAVAASGMGRDAVTKYKILEYHQLSSPICPDLTLVDIQLVTGRTHQIRVHFSSIKFPLVGDPLYGRSRVNKFFEQEFGLGRLFLHAARLTFSLPRGKRVSFEAPLPKELRRVLDLVSRG